MSAYCAPGIPAITAKHTLQYTCTRTYIRRVVRVAVEHVPGHGNGGSPTEKGEPAEENIGGGGGAKNCGNADSGQNEGPAPTPRPIPRPMPMPAVGGEGASGRAAPETPADMPDSESAFRSINACNEHEVSGERAIMRRTRE